MAGEVGAGRGRRPNVGWIAAAAVLLITFCVAGGVWFLFHP